MPGQSTRRPRTPKLESAARAVDEQAISRAMADNVPVLLVYVDEQERYQQCNLTYEQWVGVPRSSILGRRVRDVLGEDRYAKVCERIHLALRGAEQRFEVEWPHRTLGRRHVSVTYSPDIRPDGRVAGFVACSIDVTAKREAELRAQREREHLHELFLQAPAAIAILTGPDHVYALSNPVNNQSLGKDPTGLSVREAFPDSVDQGIVALLDRVYTTGEPYSAREALFVTRDEHGARREVFADFVYQPMRSSDGRIEGVLVFGFDVTDKVLARRAAEDSARRLDHAVKIRDDFLSIAGHELRTPLAALQLQVQGLERIAAKEEVPRARLLERVGKMQHHVSRLERLITELLDVSRITAGHLMIRWERVDLVRLVEDVTERFAPQLAAARSTIHIDAPGEVVGEWDRLRLDQMITNLLGNAIKYGSGKPIEITVAADAAHARLIVRDHGIGISPRDRARVFERFERAVSDRHYGGFGLGLWITRQVIEAHRGSISFESEDGEGTTFVVELPLRRPQ